MKRGAKKTMPLHLFPPSEPLEYISIDVMGPLPTTSAGNKYLLVIVDRFSKLAAAVPLKKQDSDHTCSALLDRWFSYYGLPIAILSDDGSNFSSKFTQVFKKTLGVQQAFTTEYRPNTNGQVEALNATLADMLAHSVTSEKQLDRHVGAAVYSYNSTVHSSTGFTPFELSLVRAPEAYSKRPDLSEAKGTKAEVRHSLLYRASKLAEEARERLTASQERYKRIYDAHVRQRSGSKIDVGCSVFVKTFITAPARSTKLLFPVCGPFPLIAVDGFHVKIATPDGVQRLHVDRVFLCPSPKDLPPGVEVKEPKDPPKNKREGKNNDKDKEEYIVDRLVSHARVEDGRWVIRVRWAGYTSAGDPWEPPSCLPRDMVEKCQNRKKVSLNL